MRKSARLPLALLASLLLAGAAGVGKGENPPGLYELMARSEMAVLARIVSGSLKLARVEVQEVFRGSAQRADQLQIAFRDINSSLSKKDQVVFADGETCILFLVPELDWEGKPKGKQRYTLCRGRFGKFNLPREGSDLYLEALREFARLASLKDHRQLFSELKELLGSRNSLLVDAGLEEIGRLQLMDRAILPAVIPFLQDPSPRRRVASLRLLTQLFETMKERDDPPDLQDTLLPAIESLARNDPDERVRVAAVRALGMWGGESVASALQQISEQDEKQAVRYEAKVILLRRAGSPAREP